MTAQPPASDPADPGGLAGKIPLFAEIEKLMRSQSGPVNWELARQTAIKEASEGDLPVDSATAEAVRSAMALADLWLDPVTSFPSGLRGPGEAWTRVRWVELTLAVWQSLCDPVAAKVVGAMGSSLQSGLAQLQGEDRAGLPPELAGLLPSGDLSAALSPMLGVMNQIGGLMFGAQVGQAIGALSREVVSSTEVGLPLGPEGSGALLAANVTAFGEGLEVPAEEVRLYLALREAAHHRLFGHVPWLRGRLLAAVEDYARGIAVDPDALQKAFGGVDPSDPSSMERAIGSGLFDAETSPEQQAALDRLETLLALVEGWVDEVVDAAAGPLPASPALRETVRRRRASGGPAEQTFATLVGLQLRPRRLREAARLWHRLGEQQGVAGRDAVWAHPDLLPGADDLSAPEAYLTGLSSPLDSSGSELGEGSGPEPGPDESAAGDSA